jgi:CHAT domain-containing protein/tetratricopeptide (TPR) repeat protein
MTPTDVPPHLADLQQQLAALARQQQYDQALPIARRIWDLARQELGADHPFSCGSLCDLAGVHLQLGDFASAAPLYRQAIDILRRSGDEDPAYLAYLLGCLARSLQGTGDLASAVPPLEEACGILRAALGAEHLQHVNCLKELLDLHIARGDTVAAEPLAREAVALARRSPGEGDLLLAYLLERQAFLALQSERPAEAEPLAREAAAVVRRAAGERHLYTVYIAPTWARSLLVTGEGEAARRVLQEAVEVGTNERFEGHPNVLACLSLLVRQYLAENDFAAAEPLAERALAGARRWLRGADSPLLLDCLEDLLYCTRAVGKFPAAEPLAREALALAGRLFGPEGPRYADRLQGLAIVCRGMHNYAEAEALYRQALDLRRRAGGDQGAGAAGCLASLGELYVVMGRHAAAEVVLGEAAELVRRCNPGSGEHALVLNNLGQLYLETGRPAEAAVLLDEACQVGRRAFGEGDPLFASILNNLAHACLRCGGHAEAEPLYEQSLRALRAATGGGHPNYAATLHALARLYAGTGRADRALPLMQEAEAIQDQLLAHLTSAPEAQRQAHLRGELLTCGWWWVLSLAARSGAPGAAIDLALDVTLRRKAVGLEAAATQREALMSGRYPALAPKLRELADLRFREAGEVLAGAGPAGPAARQQRLGQLRAERDRLEAELARNISELPLDQKLQAADRQAVAAALPVGSALVEFVLWRPYHFEAVASLDLDVWRPARYAAFVLAAGEPDGPRLIDLGDATPLDRLVASFRAATDDAGRAGRNLTRDEPPPATSRPSPGAALRAAVFDPLRPALSGRTRLLLAPDGDLSRLAFEALPLPEGGHLIDAYRVSYLSAGRDVLRFGAPRAGQPGPAVVVADPDFDLAATPTSPPGATGAWWAPTPREPPAAPACRGLRGVAIRFARLPGTRAEGEQVGALLGVRPWLGGEAVKGRLKECHSPRVLHLATHGFFLGKDQELEARRDELGWEGGAPAGSLVLERGTMLRSGLALGGANTWLRGGVVPAGAEEGLLTAEEACALDLGSTELVVLSACDTGLGEGQGSEGIFGLRRSFQLSGASTLVMSLWKVDDLATAFLMGRFYDNLLARGLDRDLSLSEAQRSTRAVTVGQLRAEWLNAATIDHLASGDGEARRALRELARQPDVYRPFEYPFYWGAFICQGDTAPLPGMDPRWGGPVP